MVGANVDAVVKLNMTFYSWIISKTMARLNGDDFQVTVNCTLTYGDVVIQKDIKYYVPTVIGVNV